MRVRKSCTLHHLRPFLILRSFSSGHHYEMIEESQNSKMVSVRSFLVLRAESGDDSHQYSCRAIHPAIVYSQPPLVAAIRLAVFREFLIHLYLAPLVSTMASFI